MSSLPNPPLEIADTDSLSCNFNLSQTVHIPKHIQLPEENNDPLQSIATLLKKAIVNNRNFQSFNSVVQSCSTIPVKKHHLTKKATYSFPTSRYKTWQEFSSAYSRAAMCGIPFNEDDVLEKYRQYLYYGEEINQAESQFLQWLNQCEQQSLAIGSYKRQRESRVERIKSLFTKLRWHLTDRFVPEVLIQPSKKQNRGRRPLPKEAIGILKKWLFNHFGHPYPNQTEKQQLSLQTGLSVQQISYWFINARVRIWKPLVDKFGKNHDGILLAQKAQS